MKDKNPLNQDEIRLLTDLMKKDSPEEFFVVTVKNDKDETLYIKDNNNRQPWGYYNGTIDYSGTSNLRDAVLCSTKKEGQVLYNKISKKFTNKTPNNIKKYNPETLALCSVKVKVDINFSTNIEIIDFDPEFKRKIVESGISKLSYAEIKALGLEKYATFARVGRK